MAITFVQPQCDSIGNSLKQDITIKFSSDTNTLDTSSVVVGINGETIFDDGKFVCGFEGYALTDGYINPHEYIVSFTPITSFSADKEFVIMAVAADGYNAWQDECSFKTQCSDCLSNITLVAVSGSGVYYLNNLDSSSTPELLWDATTTPVRIIDNNINVVREKRVDENTYVIIGTNGGTSVIKNCISSFCYGGANDGYLDGYCGATINEKIDGYGRVLDGYCSRYVSRDVYMDDLGNLYILNESRNRVETFYDVPGDYVGRNLADYSYSSATVPEIIDGYFINDVYVVEYFSSISQGSNTLFLAADNWLIRIDADESNPAFSESNMLVKTYGIVGSGADYEILGGIEPRTTMSVYDRDNYILAVVCENESSGVASVTTIDLRVNAAINYTKNLHDVENIIFFSSNS